MAKVVSLINLKGGVGKTTTTVQLAECLVSEFGKKVLVVDLDPQTNATISLIDEEKWEELDAAGQTLAQLFLDRIDRTSVFQLQEAIQPSVSNLGLTRLSVLPSSIRFIDIQDRIHEVSPRSGFALNPMEVLQSALRPKLPDYDYVLIDCPPNLGFITRNGIEISDGYLIPTIPDTLSTYGIPQIVKTIHQFTQERPLKIKCIGLVVTKFDSRSSAHERGMRNLPSRFAKIFSELGLSPAPVFKTAIPQATKTSDAMDVSFVPKSFKEKYGYGTSGGQPLHQYVTELTREFIQNVG